MSDLRNSWDLTWAEKELERNRLTPLVGHAPYAWSAAHDDSDDPFEAPEPPLIPNDLLPGSYRQRSAAPAAAPPRQDPVIDLDLSGLDLHFT